MYRFTASVVKGFIDMYALLTATLCATCSIIVLRSGKSSVALSLVLSSMVHRYNSIEFHGYLK